MKRAHPEAKLPNFASVRVFMEGEPVAKGRPRMTRSGHAYTPARTRKYEAQLQKVAKIAMGPRPPIACSVALILTATFAIPASASKKARAAIMDAPVTKRPDLDNVVKIACDAINGIVIEDDALITKIVATKRWGHWPSLELFVLPDMDARRG